MKRALVSIGVNNCKGFALLHSAVDGAKEMDKWGRLNGYETRVIIDETNPVTFANVYQAINEIIETRIYDQLIVYFSGHGILKAPNWEVWLLSDALNNPNEAINLSGSIDLSRNCGLSHILFISDACRSAAATYELQCINGSILFPIRAPRKSTDIDSFYATNPGNPALEISTDLAIKSYEAVFSACLMDALLGKVSTVKMHYEDKQVISSRPLKPYLLKEVPARASAKSIRYIQNPEIRVESDLPFYLCEFIKEEKTSFKPSEAPEDEFISFDRSGINLESIDLDTPSNKLEYKSAYSISDIELLSVFDSLSRLKKSYFETDAILYPEDTPLPNDPFKKDIDFLIKTKGRESFETRTGFTIVGSNVESAITNGEKNDFELDIFGNKSTHITINPEIFNLSSLGNINFLNTVIRFGSGKGTCLNALPGYVCTVIMDNDQIIAVNYVPSTNTVYSDEYKNYEKNNENKKAFAAVAAKNGYLDFDDYEFLFLNRWVDPTLLIYGAYALAQKGKSIPLSILSKNYFLNQKLGYTIPFDVYMLTYRYSLEKIFGRPVGLPMITQGWSSLGVFDQILPSSLLEIRSHVLPSLWSLYSKTGMDILEKSSLERELQ